MARRIPLTQGKYALVDDEDFDRLARFSWWVYQDFTTKRYYAARWARKEERKGRSPFSIPMHLQILGPKKNKRIDHVNPEETLDNRRCNLRYATASQNGANRKAPSHNSSGFKGVSWHKQRQRWRAFIKVHRKQIHLGLHDSKELAAKTYDEAALKYFGKFAYLNFPVEMATHSGDKN